MANKIVKNIGIAFLYTCITAVLTSYSFIVLTRGLYSSIRYCASGRYDKVFGQIICTYHPVATTIITALLAIVLLFLIKRISGHSWHKIIFSVVVIVIIVYVSIVLFKADENLYQAYQMDTISETHKNQCYTPGLRSLAVRPYNITDRYIWIREFLFEKKDSLCPVYEYFKGN